MSARFGPAIAFAALLAMLALGAVLVQSGATSGMSRHVYLNVDLPLFIAVAVAALAVGAAVAFLPDPMVRNIADRRLERTPVLALSVIAFVLGALGVHLVQHGYAFSMDEWMTRLQGAIFLEGRLAGELPEPFRDHGRALVHSFAAYDPPTGLLASDYRPGMAAIHAAFDVFGLGVYAAAVLNGVAVWLAASVARRLIPTSRSAPVVAALLVLGSTQALAAATTSYAMSAHLCFNLLWLRLFIEDRWRWHVAAALVGVATAALHQIHMHAFFAAPFLLTLLRPFRPGLIAMYGAVYLVGHGAVFGWDMLSMRGAVGAEGEEARSLMDRALRLLHLPTGAELATVSANLVRFVGWQSVALPLLVAPFVLRATWGRWPVLLVASVGFSLLPYVFLMPDQGHGWGYRYMHGLIGPVALLGAFGWAALGDVRWSPRCRAGVVIALIVAPLALIPQAASRMDAVVGPYAAATAAAEATDADIVLVDDFVIFYGGDITRNDPFLRDRPLLMRMSRLNEGAITELCAAHRVVYFGAEQAAALGVRAFASTHPTLAEQYEVALSEMAAANCGRGG